MEQDTKKNLRKSQIKIENIFIELALVHEVRDIKVSEICKKANINRSTFYANYTDIYDLLDTIHERLIKDFMDLNLFETSKFKNYISLFHHIREHKDLFNLYFRLGLDNKFDLSYYDPDMADDNFDPDYLEYHLLFIKGGFTAILKKWLADDCDIEPEQLVQIIETEYVTRLKDVDNMLKV